MKRAGFLSILLALCVLSQAQSVRGVMVDPVEGTKVRGATVQLKSAADTTQSLYTVADSTGSFSFSGISLGQYVLQASSVGFEFLQMPVNITDSIPDLDLGDVYLPKKTETLEGVVVVARPAVATQRGDTTQYSASQFKVNPDATVEDLVKKMPGVTVDRSGNVTAQGEQVRKVTVDGKDFFGDDATAALRNLPADVVDKIQVFDRLSEQAQLTGFDDGNSQRSINVVTKSGVSNGQFGRVYAGYGTNNRYQAGGNMSFFSGDRRISLVGNFNNVNQQNFAGQDLLGVTSSGGGRGGRGGGGRGAGNFMVGQAPGISRTNAFGINYADKWGEKLTVSGSYFFNNRKTENESLTSRTTTVTADSLLAENNWYSSLSDDYNHRLNMRFEYKLDSNNTFFYIPSVSFQNNNSTSDYWSNGRYLPDDSTNSSNGLSESLRNGYNINNLLMYRRAFSKRGRSLFLSLNSNHSKNDGYRITDEFTRSYFPDNTYKDSLQNQKTTNNTNSQRYGARIGYTEPIGEKNMLEFSYNTSVQLNEADNNANLFDGTDYTIPFTRLSNQFDNKVLSNTVGLNFRRGQSRDNQLSFGVEYQNNRLQSERVLPNPASVNQTFGTFLPNLRWMRKVGRFSNFRIFYRANTDLPNVNQLQDVPNTANMLRPSVGNPGLKQSYSNYVSGRYTYTNTQNNNVFFANISARTTNNYISNATYIVRGMDSTIEQGVTILRNAQLSKPVNLNGYRSLYSMLTYSTPLGFIKSNLTINGGANYECRPGLINYRNTITENIVYNGGISLSSNISEYIDYGLSYNVNFNNVKSNVNANSNNRFVNQALGVQVNLLSKNGWLLQNDLSHQRYTGLTLPGSQTYWLWNAGIGKKFLKNNAGELKLSVFDLLNQNQSYARNVGDNYFEDSQNLVLRQYFMLTFTYSLKNFGKGRSSSSGGDNRGMRREGGPPAGGMGMPGGRPPGGFM